MTFTISYRMLSGVGLSTCASAIEAVQRRRDLVLAGASSIVISHDGIPVTLAALELLTGRPAPFFSPSL